MLQQTISRANSDSDVCYHMASLGDNDSTCNGYHSADGIFKWIFLMENICIWILICRKFVCKGEILKKSTLIHVMAWCHLAPSHYLNQSWPTLMTPMAQWSHNNLISSDLQWKFWTNSCEICIQIWKCSLPQKTKKVWNMSFHLDFMYDKSIFICSNK